MIRRESNVPTGTAAVDAFMNNAGMGESNKNGRTAGILSGRPPRAGRDPWDYFLTAQRLMIRLLSGLSPLGPVCWVAMASARATAMRRII